MMMMLIALPSIPKAMADVARFAIRELQLLEGIGLSVDVLSRVREPVELDPISIKPVRIRNEK